VPVPQIIISEVLLNPWIVFLSQLPSVICLWFTRGTIQLCFESLITAISIKLCQLCTKLWSHTYTHNHSRKALDTAKSAVFTGQQSSLVPNQEFQSPEKHEYWQHVSSCCTFQAAGHTHQFDMRRIKPSKPRIVFQRRNNWDKLPAITHYTAGLVTV